MREIQLNKECNYIHLLSGGLDSAYSILSLAIKLKGKEKSAVIHPIFFDYGQNAADTEWARVEEIVNYIRNFLNDKSVIDDPVKISLKSELFQWCKSQAFSGIEGEEDPEIENRNLVLFSVLASYLIACANHGKISKTRFKISSGFKEKELPDCNGIFFKKFTQILHMYNRKRAFPKDLKFKFCILDSWDRQTVINETKKLLKDNETELKKFLGLTTSCYSPTNEGKPCYKCCKCDSIREKKIEGNKVELKFSM